MQQTNEVVVKCNCIANEDQSIVTWEDFAIYCERNGKNPYREILDIDPHKYYEMQVVDYILGNTDRHEGNWGFFVDNNTGEILSLHPLMDHDHAFSNEILYSQTVDNLATMEAVAFEALQHVKMNLEPLLYLEKPKELTEEQWQGVLERTGKCLAMQKT